MELNQAEVSTLLLVASVHIVAAVSPGQSVVLVAHTAARVSRRAAMISALAMGVGALIWASLALFGVNAIVASNPNLYFAVRTLGAAFLVWTGYQMYRTAEHGGGSSGALLDRKVFWQSLKMQMANPKVVVFFSSIFLATLPENPRFLLKAAILTIIFVNETLWYALLAYVLSMSRPQMLLSQYGKNVSRVCAVLLVCIGIRLLFFGR